MPKWNSLKLLPSGSLSAKDSPRYPRMNANSQKVENGSRGEFYKLHQNEASEESKEMLEMEEEVEPRPGMGIYISAYFIIAQMAGAGFLALPKGISDCGWGGAFLMFVLAASVAFISIRLGDCWVILEERWPQYRKPVRQPFMDIAEITLGIHARRLALASLLITQIGSTIVYFILMAQMMNDLINHISQCQWILIIATILMPFVWLDSPKDFWQASILAVVATAAAVIAIVAKLIVDRDIYAANLPTYLNPSLGSFSLGFSTILFCFGGAPVLPTIQNDMKNRSEFWKSTILGFIGLLILYAPVGLTGYSLLGNSVTSNILLSVNPGPEVTAAIAMQMINLLGTYIIAINPVVLSLEDIVGVPREFGWKRVSLRTILMTLELIVAFSIPDFGLIVNLIGGSTMCILSFILPPLMYMKLVDDRSDSTWPQRKISLGERIILWVFVGIGVIGGVIATISSAMALFRVTSLQTSCFLKFFSE